MITEERGGERNQDEYELKVSQLVVERQHRRSVLWNAIA